MTHLVLQRPGLDTVDELGAAQTPPESQCCFAAPPVLVFDTQGNLLQSWGGPGEGFDWPKREHGIYVDKDDSVWISGAGPGDRQILKFKSDGHSSCRLAILPRIQQIARAPIFSGCLRHGSGPRHPRDLYR